jgi:hypothetical protein
MLGYLVVGYGIIAASLLSWVLILGVFLYVVRGSVFDV